ncbi:NAD(P)H-dependent oxidoreductase [Achromobacter sp. Marseille-Q0513]|uniref:NAD(P)H-dependent oxidoreductase n=1 Tax=Achromobacter sp. Marseille-Q0513 TaxID=2829161 RepID=UPI001BA191F9|nr:NAD(P)H-dependent oxidoreductase [Achromobacter sp. Marseille-Q0513]MBR8653829.1 NAD(P)H-dependent oxidoreductase [Achromobacter sp. Marseille-Q0513]
MTACNMKKDRRILFVCGHPDVAASRYQERLLHHCKDVGIDHLVLANEFEESEFSVSKMQELLINSDRIILSFPFYWYGFPALMKRWFDDVFLPGFAYATGGDKLHGKEFLICTTVGAPSHAYSAAGFNNFTMDELLRPIQQSIQYIGGVYLPPYIIFSSLFIDARDIVDKCNSAIDHFKRTFKSKGQIYRDMIAEAERSAISLLAQPEGAA